MDICLWRARIVRGKESLANEWLAFLRENREEGERTLKNEREHLEIYFTEQENDAMYLYIFVMADDLAYAAEVAKASMNPLDEQHFAYMSACLDSEGWTHMQPALALGDMTVFDKQ